jgi:hypothetical protein
MESGPGFEFVKLWSKLGRRVSPPPKELQVWIWFRRNVLLNDHLRVKFQHKNQNRLLVSTEDDCAELPKNWARCRTRCWPYGMRIYKNHTSKGSFLAILKQLHKTHLHPNLPFIIVSAQNGLAIRSRTSQFKRLSDAVVGRARLVPTKLIDTNGTTPKILFKLREYVSVMELSPRELFVVWGPLALVNHSCNSSIGFEAEFGDGYIPKVGKSYRWGLQKFPYSTATSSDLAGNGKELHSFYRTCEGETDFTCKDCLKQGERRAHKR